MTARDSTGYPIVGRILDMLRDAGELGMSTEEMMFKGYFIKKIVVYQMIRSIRKLGLRIDYEGGRYFYRGQGVSLYNTTNKVNWEDIVVRYGDKRISSK